MKGEVEGEREEEEKRTQKTTTLDEKTLMKKLVCFPCLKCEA